MGKKYADNLHELRRQFLGNYNVSLSEKFDPRRFGRSFELGAKLVSTSPKSIDEKLAKEIGNARAVVEVECESKKYDNYIIEFALTKPSGDAEKLAPSECFHSCMDVRSSEPLICKHVYRALSEIDEIPGCYKSMFIPNDEVCCLLSEIEHGKGSPEKKLEESFGAMEKLRLEELKYLDRLNRRIWDFKIRKRTYN